MSGAVVEQRSTSGSARDLVTSVLGALVVAGVYADGWAHVHLGGLESFFTPWHGMLYGAFSALALWIVALVLHRRRSGNPWSASVPSGHGWGLIGIAVFAAGGLADMLWHLAFGVETGIDALVSPTHLMLLSGGVLLLLTPLRAWTSRASGPDTRSEPMAAHGGTDRTEALPWSAVLAVASTAALAAFFVGYLSVFADPGAVAALTSLPEDAPGHREAELPVVAGLGGYLVGTVVMVVAYLHGRRFGGFPLGGLTMLVAAIALSGAALSAFEYLLPAVVAVATTALLELGTGIHQREVVATALPGTVWGGQLAGLALQGELAWSVELWLGVTTLTMLTGLALASTTARPAARPRVGNVVRPGPVDAT